MPEANYRIMIFIKSQAPAQTPEEVGSIWINKTNGAIYVSTESGDTITWRETVGAQSDWNITDKNSPAYILNKPNIPEKLTQTEFDAFLKTPVSLAIILSAFTAAYPLAPAGDLVDGTSDARVGISPKHFKVATEAIARAAAKLSGVKDLFDSVKTGLPELDDRFLVRHESKNRKVLSDEHDLTSREGDTLGMLSTGNIDVFASDKEEVHYAVTDNVHSFSLGDDQVDDQFIIPAERPSRILQIHTAIGREVSAVMIVRRRTATAPGYVVIATDYNAGQLSLDVVKGDGSALRSTQEYQNLGWINGLRSGGWLFQNVDDNGNFVADQFNFQNIVFGPSDAPKEVSNIHLTLEPQQSLVGGVYHPRISIGLANSSEEVIQNKKYPLSALLPLIAGVSAETLKEDLQKIENEIDTLRHHLGQNDTSLISINDFPLVAPTIQTLIGVTDAQYQAAARTTEYQLRVAFNLSASEAATLNAAGLSNISMLFHFVRIEADPQISALTEGLTVAVFSIQKIALEQIINNVLDAGSEGAIDVELSTVDGSGDVQSRITRTTLVIDKTFSREGLTEPWARVGSEELIPFDKIVQSKWARRSVSNTDTLNTVALINTALAGIVFRSVPTNRYLEMRIYIYADRSGNRSGQAVFEIEDAINPSIEDLKVSISNNASSKYTRISFKAPANGVAKLVCKSLTDRVAIGELNVRVELRETLNLEIEPTTDWD